MIKSICLITISLALSLSAVENQVEITKSTSSRIIKSNGIPAHKTGQGASGRNPHRMSSQNFTFKVPLKPKRSQNPRNIGMNYFGVALNGVPFDPAAAEYWNRDRSSGWQYEAVTPKEKKLGVDNANGHVQPNGSYHYHALPELLYKSLKNPYKKMTLLGWAADGFPIYAPYGYSNRKDSKSRIKELKSSYQLKKGSRKGQVGSPRGKHDGTFTQDYEYIKGSGDLDSHNGRYGVTPEFPKGTYYYVLTNSYPYIPRTHMGIADSSFSKRNAYGNSSSNRSSRGSSSNGSSRSRGQHPDGPPPRRGEHPPRRGEHPDGPPPH